jgi:hypothetical protein
MPADLARAPEMWGPYSASVLGASVYLILWFFLVGSVVEYVASFVT